MKRVLGMAAVAALYMAGPAQAADVKINLSGNSAIVGADGNSRTFSGSAGATTVNVKATGWSLDNKTVRDSFLGDYNQGLGVTSGDDLFGLFNLHVVDNQNRADFILLQFDQAVQLTSAMFNAFQIGFGSKDTDATIGWGSTSAAWTSALNLDGTNVSVLNSMVDTQTSKGTSAGGLRDLSAIGQAGNLWLIGAAFKNADKITDGFKLGEISVKTVSPVPEPSTWALMLAGFALVGVAMRRAVRTSEQRFTDKVRQIAAGVA